MPARVFARAKAFASAHNVCAGSVGLCQAKAASSLPLHELAGDDEPLDFGGAFVDAQGADVAVHALDHGATDETGAAVNLDGAVDDASGGFGGEQLCFTRFACYSAVFR